MSHVAYQAEADPGFCSIKKLRVFRLLLFLFSLLNDLSAVYTACRKIACRKMAYNARNTERGCKRTQCTCFVNIQQFMVRPTPELVNQVICNLLLKLSSIVPSSLQLRITTIRQNQVAAPERVLPEKIGRGVRLASQNPYPIYDKNQCDFPYPIYDLTKNLTPYL